MVVAAVVAVGETAKASTDANDAVSLLLSQGSRRDPMALLMARVARKSPSLIVIVWAVLALGDSLAAEESGEKEVAAEAWRADQEEIEVARACSSAVFSVATRREDKGRMKRETKRRRRLRRRRRGETSGA